MAHPTTDPVTRLEPEPGPIEQARDVLYAGGGSGPLFQRDYVAAIEGSKLTPPQLAELVRTRFAEFAPSETAAFERAGGEASATGGRGREPLRVGDEMSIRLSGLMKCKVRVVCVDDLSLTLRTLAGHPEAGRITFGAGRDGEGRLTFRIRSRARAGGFVHLLGWMLIGKAMQGRCWIRFIRRVAEVAGGTIPDAVHVSTERVVEEDADCGAVDLPTFTCDCGG